MIRLAKFISPFLLMFGIMACGGPRIASPEQLVVVAPTPINGNSGQYMSPYTSDGVLAEWVDKSINAKMGAELGGAVGAYAGKKLMENIPVFGGWLGKTAGQEIGREIAIKAAGGEEFIRNTSDLSFNSLEDLSVYLYVNYSTNEHYRDALDAAMAIYPELKQNYHSYIIEASSKVL